MVHSNNTAAVTLFQLAVYPGLLKNVLRGSKAEWNKGTLRNFESCLVLEVWVSLYVFPLGIVHVYWDLRSRIHNLQTLHYQVFILTLELKKELHFLENGCLRMKLQCSNSVPKWKNNLKVNQKVGHAVAFIFSFKHPACWCEWRMCGFEC